MACARGALSGSLLLIDDDNVLLDYLGQVFETREFDVVCESTMKAGLARIAERPFDVVVTGWEVAGGHDATLYRDAVKRRPELRDQFIFLAAERPDRLEEVVEGKAACADHWEVENLIRLAEEAARRAREQASLQSDQLIWLGEDRPTMLLIEDSALELMAMCRMLGDFGFDVTPADCGNAAIARLAESSYHVILSDWYMDDGSGADLFAWLIENRPDMAQRVVFMSGAAPKDFDQLAPGRPLIPKGQDSPQLVQTVVRVARGK